MIRTFLLCALIGMSTCTIVLRPTKQTSQQYGIIWIQGALTPADRYKPLMAEIQNQFANTLWAAIPEFSSNTPEPVTIKGKVQDALKELHSQGMPADAPVFFGGHSLGTVMVQDLLKNNTDIAAKGMILTGGFIQRKYLTLRSDGQHQNEVTVPTLSIGGELDGLARVSRFAEALFTQGRNSVQSFSKYPIVIVPGAAHNSFSSGEPSSFVKSNDMIPEVAEADAHKATAKHAVNFMNSLTGGAAFQEDKFTIDLLQPMLDALVLEGYNNFKPPCYDNKLINPNVATCLHGSAWAAIAQASLAGLQDTKTVVQSDPNFHRVESVNPVHLPEIDNDCDGVSSCTLKTIVVVEAIYDKLLPMDTGLQMISASELKTKLVSRQNAWTRGGKKAQAADFEKTDSANLCAEANQLALDWATVHAPERIKTRFSKYGQHMRVGSDLGPYNAGPLWIWTFMNYVEETDAQGKSVITVQAPMMKTPLDYWAKDAAGFHYCKILSPARALEWMYSDGLKKQRSLKTQQVEM